MRDELEEVLLLQTDYSAQNTPEMQRRGLLVRQVIANEVRQLLPQLVAASGIDDIAVQGKDGTGRKTEIPWLRFYSESRSPSATTGWYVVYLFAARGDRVYLSLNQGTTQWTGVEFKPRPADELSARVAWARGVLASEPDYPGSWTPTIQLDGAASRLGAQYELGNVVAAEYPLNAIPDEKDLADDLVTAAKWLGALYRAEATGMAVPGEVAPEILDAEQAIRRASGKSRGKGQGFRLSVADKRAIENHAVDVATAHLTTLGFAVSNVGATKSFDLEARNGVQLLMVEVKGTTSLGEEVILTRNEVELHQVAHPDNALVVVHSIVLDRSVSPPVASGGVLEYWQPWELADVDLTPMAYRYRTGL